MRLGTYLIDRGLIGPAQLRGALEAQLRARPTPTALGVELGYLTEDQALDILQRQIDAGAEFRQVATEELYLTDGEVRQLGRSVQARTPRLGAFLVEQGAIDAARLERALAEARRSGRR